MNQDDDQAKHSVDAIRSSLFETAVEMILAAARNDPERERIRLQTNIAELSQELDEARVRLSAIGATEAQVTRAVGSMQDFKELYQRVLDRL